MAKNKALMAQPTKFEQENSGVARQFIHRGITPALSAVGGTVGGILGAAGGPLTGIGGAALGGAAGEAGKQLVDRTLGFDAPKTSWDAAKDIGIEGAKQGAYEVGGRVGGKVVAKALSPVGRAVAPKLEKMAEKYPKLKELLPKPPNTVGHLTAAAADKGSSKDAWEAITRTVDDIKKEMESVPEGKRTAGAFLKKVASKREALHNEYGLALWPSVGDHVDTTPIVNRVKALVKDWMNMEGRGEAEKRLIADEVTRLEHATTARDLDSLRHQLTEELAPIYGKEGNARYTALHGNLQREIDNEIVQGAKDVLYPLADRNAGKPVGYFKDVLERESNLITLRGILEKRVGELSGTQAISEVAPLFKSENISVSGHPGNAPRFGFYGLREMASPPRELKEAGEHVEAAFAPAQLDALPYQILLGAGIRTEEERPKNVGKILREAQ
jgi:hypothetical protein